MRTRTGSAGILTTESGVTIEASLTFFTIKTFSIVLTVVAIIGSLVAIIRMIVTIAWNGRDYTSA